MATFQISSTPKKDCVWIRNSHLEKGQVLTCTDVLSTQMQTLFVEIVEEFSQPEAPVWGDWKVSQGNHSQRRVKFLWAVSCWTNSPSQALEAELVQGLPFGIKSALAASEPWTKVKRRKWSLRFDTMAAPEKTWFFSLVINNMSLCQTHSLVCLGLWQCDTDRTGQSKTGAKTLWVQVWFLAKLGGCLSWSSSS